MKTTDLRNLELEIFYADVVEANEDGVVIYDSGITIRLSDSVADKIAREQTEKREREYAQADVLEGNAPTGFAA